MSPTLLTAWLVGAFACLVTVHVSIAWGLAWRRPRWRALSALLVVPLAPWLAFRARLRARAVAWLVSAIAYGVALALARR